MGIFIIDFDRTIANGHTHNTIARFYKTIQGPNPSWNAEEQQDQWNLVKHIPPITAGNLTWKTVIETMLNNGHQVAIASFSSYPHIIPQYLLQVIGLSADLVKQVHIEAWLPEQPATANKNNHIMNVLQHFKFAGHKNQVVIIDDAKTNTDAALAEHFVVIPAHDKLGNPFTDGKHLSLLLTTINNMNTG